MKLISEVQYDDSTDDLFLKIPNEILDNLDWSIGDEIGRASCRERV